MNSEKLYYRCLRCNRKLKTAQAQILGYGPCCYKKHIKEMEILSPIITNLENKEN